MLTWSSSSSIRCLKIATSSIYCVGPAWGFLGFNRFELLSIISEDSHNSNAMSYDLKAFISIISSSIFYWRVHFSFSCSISMILIRSTSSVLDDSLCLLSFCSAASLRCRSSFSLWSLLSRSFSSLTSSVTRSDYMVCFIVLISVILDSSSCLSVLIWDCSWTLYCSLSCILCSRSLMVARRVLISDCKSSIWLVSCTWVVSIEWSCNCYVTRFVSALLSLIACSLYFNLAFRSLTSACNVLICAMAVSRSRCRSADWACSVWYWSRASAVSSWDF
jgi:hypothetical protein